MNCRTARKLMPDAGNGALSKEKRLGLERHLALCRDCRRQADALRIGMEALKGAETASGMDFTEAEWTAAIRKAVAQGSPEKMRPTKEARRTTPSLRPMFAYGLAVLLAGAAIVFGVRRFPWLVPAVETRPAASGTAATGRGIGQPEMIRPIDPLIDPSALYAQVKNGTSSKQAAGDVPTLTWISQETGLQIVWFINDDIKMED